MRSFSSLSHGLLACLRFSDCDGGGDGFDALA